MDQIKEFWKELTVEQKVKYILITLGSIIALVFIIQNSGIVKIKLFNLAVKIPLFLIMILCMGFGYLLSLMINYKKVHSLKKERDKLEQQIQTRPKTIEAEIIDENEGAQHPDASRNKSHNKNSNE